MKKHAIRLTLTIVISFLLLALALFVVLCFTEYRPEKAEKLDVLSLEEDLEADSYGTLHSGDTLKIMSWNMGYGALGESADFFMDGGSKVMTADKEGVKQNVSSVIDGIKSERPAIVFLQEADQDSTRSHHINEVQDIREAMDGYQASFANNFKTLYVPYPWPPIGKVDSGLLTLSKYPISSSVRLSLPCPFKWPVRIANLKRCLMVDRVKVDGTDKELVIVNLHLEAYDDGEGKIEQTKELLKLLNAEQAKGNYVIAGGDFNQSFSNTDITMYPTDEKLWVPGIIDVKDFGDSWTLAMDNTTPTCRSLDQAYAGADPETFHYYMIDGYIVSKNVSIESLKTKDLGFKNSDHNPVMMEVKLN